MRTRLIAATGIIAFAMTLAAAAPADAIPAPYRPPIASIGFPDPTAALATIAGTAAADAVVTVRDTSGGPPLAIAVADAAGAFGVTIPVRRGTFGYRVEQRPPGAPATTSIAFVAAPDAAARLVSATECAGREQSIVVAGTPGAAVFIGTAFRVLPAGGSLAARVPCTNALITTAAGPTGVAVVVPRDSR